MFRSSMFSRRAELPAARSLGYMYLVDATNVWDSWGHHAQTMSRSLVAIPTFIRQQIRRNATSTVNPVINIKAVPAPHSGSIRILSLNRPQARNAISRQLLSDLTRHVSVIANEGGNGFTRVLILASDVDSAFCAGADLKERAGFSKQE